METLLRLAFGLLLLFLALSMALSYLAPYLKFVKRSGVPRVGKKVAASALRGAGKGLRLVIRGRMPKIRRPPMHTTIGRLR